MFKLQKISNLLYGCWMKGEKIAQLPPEMRPASEEDGYAIQALLESRSAFPLFGWKIAATSPAGQAHIQVSGPLAGRILRERLIDDGGACPLEANLMRVAELEFCFRMGKTLKPRDRDYSTSEVIDCVATLNPSIEIPDTRLSEFEKAGAPQLIADNACANYFMLGKASADIWRSIDLAAQEVTGRINNGPPQPGSGRNVLGDPRDALAWLANRLSSLGIPLFAGQIVTTGTCVVPMAIAPGDRVYGDFGELGTVELSIV
jgi:2-keto-4-pentenoate hydratase